MKNITCFIFLFLVFIQAPVAQKPRTYSAADIALELQALQVLGNVLYLAAHPDDENTRLIAYLNNEEKYRTAYLSLTRGDGGQNLIGPEIRERLGIIRTQELLQARRIDGGEQFFSRANDFGYSKHPDETFAIWEREQILSDVVYVIRTFKPDVIITRFNTEAGTTHGHHTASAILAEEAFKAAADPSRFSEQLKRTDTWQVERLFWNTSPWFYRDREDFDTSSLLKIDVGTYNPFLGKSYTEIAAESRSMHKSQGFGAPLLRGSSTEYLQHVRGSKAEQHLFEGIETSWSRVAGGEKVGNMISKAIEAYDMQDPAAIVPQLLEIYKQMKELPEHPFKEQKLREVKELIRASLGLYLEVAATEYSATPGDSLSLKIEAINRSGLSVVLQQLCLPGSQSSLIKNQDLGGNLGFSEQAKIVLPDTMPVSQPYWLVHKSGQGMFRLDDEWKVGQAENKPALLAKFQLVVEGVPLEYQLPVVYKFTEPAEGEIYQPFIIIPPVAVNAKQDKLLFTDGTARELKVEVVAGKDQVEGNLQLKLPSGWVSKPASYKYSLPQKGSSQSFHFLIEAPEKPEEQTLQVTATYKGQVYTRGMEQISYKHIPGQFIFPEAEIKLVKMELKKKGERIAYLAGAGDEVPANLEQIGYQVDMLQPQELELSKLQQYDAVVLGVRAFNTIEELKFRKKALESYARKGGTVVIQYNTSHALVDEEITPHPLQLSRNRVTSEDAPVSILQPEHPIFQGPNKITEQDFDGWVQERGLYFADEWSDEWIPLLASHDPGEEPLKGGLLVSRVGKGYYVYTSYSWFRQLPAGVPGAFRLFVNLLSLGNP